MYNSINCKGCKISNPIFEIHEYTNSVTPKIKLTIIELTDKALCEFTKDLQTLSKKREKIEATLIECYKEISKRDIAFQNGGYLDYKKTQNEIKSMFKYSS